MKVIVLPSHQGIGNPTWVTYPEISPAHPHHGLPTQRYPSFSPRCLGGSSRYEGYCGAKPPGSRRAHPYPPPTGYLPRDIPLPPLGGCLGGGSRYEGCCAAKPPGSRRAPPPHHGLPTQRYPSFSPWCLGGSSRYEGYCAAKPPGSRKARCGLRGGCCWLKLLYNS